ncbi:hypothetical protein RQP46_004123 [Phenoliferia psychrophenolica]
MQTRHSVPLNPPPPPVRVHVNDLPLEILCRIFELAQAGYENVKWSRQDIPSDDPWTVALAAQVCSRWRDPACRALYGDPILGVDEKGDVSKWVNSAARSRYPVKSCGVNEFDALLGEGLHEVVSVISTEIKALDVSWLESHWTVLCNPRLAQLQVLSVGFPNIFHHARIFLPRPLPFHLRKFEIDVTAESDISEAIPAAFLRGVFEASQNSLVHLRLTGNVAYDEGEDDPFDYFVPLLPLVAGRLLRLDLPLDPFPTCLLPLLRLLTSLKTLSLELRKFDEEWCSPSLLEFADALPATLPSLTHLRITYELSLPTVPAITPFICHRNLVNLTRLDFPEIRRKDLSQPIRVHINDLPLEILCRIFELAQVGYEDVQWSRSGISSADSKTVALAALVCRRWRDPACRALYGQLRLGINGCSDIFKWLESPASDHYPVQCCELSEYDAFIAMDGGLENIIGRLPNQIRVLNVSWLESHWTALCNPRLAQLQALSIGFPRIFHHLRRFITKPLPFQLRKFEVDVQRKSNISQAIPDAFLRGIVESSRDSLLHLRLTANIAYYEDQDDPFNCIVPLLPLVAGRLLRLDLPLDPFPTCLLPLLQLLTSLKTLSLELRKFDKEWCSPSLLAFADALPAALPSLTHLRITYDVAKPIVPATITFFIRHRNLANITRLDFPEVRRKDLFLSGELEDECRSRGIEIFARDELLDGGL